MPWSVSVTEVLRTWAVEPKPLAANERLIELARIATKTLNKILPNLDDRIAADPTLLADLNYIASQAIQRAWYQDPRGYSAISEGDGPFSKSISIESRKSGIFFDADEIDLVSPELPNGNSIFATVRFGTPNPNFNIRTNRSWRDWRPIGSHWGVDVKEFGWWRNGFNIWL